LPLNEAANVWSLLASRAMDLCQTDEKTLVNLFLDTNDGIMKADSHYNIHVHVYVLSNCWLIIAGLSQKLKQT